LKVNFVIFKGAETYDFTSDTTKRFCERNKIKIIIRGHQYVPQGFLVMHEGRLVTVFSARNYVDQVSRKRRFP